jgi:hypothetical protein
VCYLVVQLVSTVLVLRVRSRVAPLTHVERYGAMGFMVATFASLGFMMDRRPFAFAFERVRLCCAACVLAFCAELRTSVLSSPADASSLPRLPIWIAAGAFGVPLLLLGWLQLLLWWNREEEKTKKKKKHEE